MIKQQYSLPSAQRGAVILLTSVLLLSIATLVTLSTGRIKSIEYKSALNQQNHNMALAAAEAGLMRAYGVLSENKNWDGSEINATTESGHPFAVSANQQAITRLSTQMTLYTIASQGRSADGLATTTVSEQALRYSILANPPDVPLIVAGGLDVSGNFEVVANPNGGGDGVPLSIWTDGDVDMSTGSGTTCGQQEFYDGNCSTSPYSERGFQDLDILDNDVDFPTDLLEYLFNVPSADWATLRADADQKLTSCATLNAATTGFIWVDGDCTINAGTIVGQTSSPVVLIVSDGNVRMNGGATIYGIVFSFRKPGTVLDFDLNMIGGARVNGVVVSNHPVGQSAGTYNSVFDADVLAEIPVNNAFQRIARVPGSWRDF